VGRGVASLCERAYAIYLFYIVVPLALFSALSSSVFYMLSFVASFLSSYTF
jgi:hypothetical protein